MACDGGGACDATWPETRAAIATSAHTSELSFNAAGDAGFEVVVPADCVDTYDLPVDAAARLGVMPHEGDLMHRLFLYHMALNGVQVVRSLRKVTTNIGMVAIEGAPELRLIVIDALEDRHSASDALVLAVARPALAWQEAGAGPRLRSRAQR